jgi:predicted GNAT family acetyltransferase
VTTEVRNNREQSRYELLVDGTVVGVAEYHIAGDVMVIPHTEIERPRRGQGLGAQLVQHALDDARATNRRVEPQCWFVAEFIAGHPDYADLAS